MVPSVLLNKGVVSWILLDLVDRVHGLNGLLNLTADTFG